jgi:hypothetical protein
MNIFIKLLAGEMPRRVRYCERDGYVADRELRADALQRKVLPEVSLRGFSTGI